ncbi:MAG TPA: serine hydrolase [Elusimicrobia bacterium]|nr:serine hydrolase [Elusimicrobiota bacterium]
MMLLLQEFSYHLPMESLQARMEALARAHRGQVRFYAKSLATGESVELDADEPVRSASTIKLGILVEAFHQAGEGRLPLSGKVVLREEDKVQGSGVLKFLRAPLELTLEDVLTLMVIESDNTATNLAIDQVGLNAVNARFAALGLKNTRLYKKVYKPAEGPLPPDQKEFGLGKTTAREMSRLMEEAARDERMTAILKGQQNRNMIPRYIEAGLDASEGGAIVANKTGALDAQRSDVGAVFSPAGTILVSAFTDGNEDQRWTCENEAEGLIAQLAKTVFDSWGRKK